MYVCMYEDTEIAEKSLMQLSMKLIIKKGTEIHLIIVLIVLIKMVPKTNEPEK